jgi:UDPglucose 6-dehydrogenase
MGIKNICCIGAGYVGGPTMAVIADKCPKIQVNVVDVDKNRISAWNSNELPIYEPGLLETVYRVRGVNLHFDCEIDQRIAEADCIFVCVNTPTKTIGHGAGRASDLRFLEACTRRIAAVAKPNTIIVEKSTLPVKSAEAVKTILNLVGGGKQFDVLSNPEFLAEGTAIKDLCNPDRVLIGGESKAAISKLAEVYRNWVPLDRILITNIWSAEMSKLAANAILAQRVSSINSLSAFCEETGANIKEVALAVGNDSRIGPRFLEAGPGFGGSCFKKDVLNLIYLCEQHGLDKVARYWEQVIEINEWQKRRIVRLMLKKMYNCISGKRIAVLGFAFKKDTNDLRESPAISICLELIEEGAYLTIYDPKVPSHAIEGALSLKKDYSDSGVIIARELPSVFVSVDAVLVLTAWDVFKEIEWDIVSKLMRHPAWIFDTRRCLDSEKILSSGLNYWALGT